MARMLNIPEKKIKRFNGKKIELHNGDAVQLPIKDAEYDALTMSLGCNVPDVPANMREMYRVLGSGGKALILEFSLPKNPIVRFSFCFIYAIFYHWFGGLISGDYAAYKYLNTGIESISIWRRLLQSNAQCWI